MGSDGRINDLGRQYIGAVAPNTTSDYIPGVVNGGEGGQPSDNNNDGNSSPLTSIFPSVSSALAAGLFAALLT